MKRAHLTLLAGCAGVLSIALSTTPLHAQDLPPELTGDYTSLPPPQPAPKPATPPAPTRTPPTPAPAPTRAPHAQPSAPTRPARPQQAPELEAPIDPELGDVGPVADPDATPPEFETPSDPAPEGETPEPDTDEAQPPEEDAPEAAPAAQSWRVGLGVGVGTLAFTRPAAGGVQRLATSPYAAMDIDVRGWLGAQNGLSWGLLARYQTSLGWALERDNVFGLPENVATRTQALELSLAPTFRLSDAAHLAFPIGAALRWFVPKVHQYPLEPYTLGSLVVRAEAIVTLTDNVTLRIGPEAHWILFVNRALEREGACCSGGAIGGQGSLQARLGETFSLAVDYRESRSLIPVAARFSAVERVAIARIVGEL